MIKIRCTDESITNSNDINTILNYFKTRHAEAIKKHCRITPDTEWSMDNFGIGSAWCYESPFVIGLEWCEDATYLTIREVGVDPTVLPL